ncbi:MAG: aminoglycoside phosphotransferase family protein [Phenylobacterium sp.]
MAAQSTGFAPWLARWGLTPDGEPFETAYTGSRLLPVRQGGAPAMLKIATAREERRGAVLMRWWAGEGAARVLAQEGEALLLERLEGPGSLAAMARSGQDDAASRILCDVAARLHAPRPGPAPADLAPLATWLRALAPAAAAHGGVLTRSLQAADGLLADPREVCVLHGDLHHGNVLDGGPRGWLAIDPKGVMGERGYDYANILCNPDAETATTPGRLAQQAAVVAVAARLEPQRLLTWLLVHAGVSAAWSLRDGWDPAAALKIAEMAAAELS